MKTLTRNLKSILVVVALLSQVQLANANSCKELLKDSDSEAIRVSLTAEKHQKTAEKYAKKMQKLPFFRRTRRVSYRFLTNLLLRKNLGTNRLSEESTKDVYEETVTTIKALLGESLITDKKIQERDSEIKAKRTTLLGLKAKKVELESKVTEGINSIARLNAQMPSENSNLITEGRSRDQLEQNLREKIESEESALETNQYDLEELIKKIEVKELELAEIEKTFKERKALRNELTKDILNGLKEYRSLPKKIQGLIDNLMVREHRLKVLLQVVTNTPVKVSLPEINTKGDVIWTIKDYDIISAEAEIKSIRKNIVNKIIRTQLKELLGKQTRIYRKLKIFRDYLTDAKDKNPESFGPLKERILRSILEALNTMDNFPGYKALIRYERQIFIEEFMEAYGFGKDSQTPRERIRKKLLEQGGVALEDFSTAIGSVKNTAGKQVFNAVRTLVLSAAVTTGVSTDLILPEKVTDARSSAIGAVSSKATGFVDQGLYMVDRYILGFSKTAYKLADIPKDQRTDWLINYVDNHKIDLSSEAGQAQLKFILAKTTEIDTTRNNLSAEQQELTKQQKAIIDGLLLEE